MRPDSRLPWLDLARGLAALVVCVGHLRSVMFVDYVSLTSSSLATKLLYAATGLGRASVMVFFVLSGYFVGGSVLAQGRAFSVSSYARARLVRLWIVLIPALVLTALVDHAISVVSPETLQGVYYDLWFSGPKPGEYSASPLTFLGNVFFLQTIAVPWFGTNGPLWSLANEGWYYVMFPLLVYASGKGPKGSLATRGLSLLLTAVMLWIAGLSISVGFLIWLLGALVAYVTARGVRAPSWLVLPGLLLFAFTLGFDRLIGFSRPWLSDLAIGAAFAPLLLPLVSAPLPRRAQPLARLSTGLSEISYSLYLVHYPFVIWLGAVSYTTTQLQPTATAFLKLLGWSAAMLVGSTAFWWLFESRTVALRGWLERRFSPERAATSVSPSR